MPGAMGKVSCPQKKFADSHISPYQHRPTLMVRVLNSLFNGLSALSQLQSKKPANRTDGEP
jgi:hypothetical protein